ncbi:hypothetical protein KDW_20400 [Dictyobacter vulcani]|uniref:Uncharacterized protein n=1 Tax=Dictyobacter vulcani TaxID=2607529 RepID=A0A5J4KEX4_9CHLR|nr:hypothetical protein [Dictyobacter vulcani]GER87878.1 hypothetical protein KDW_20400 [Dictyobacter vulcani]
MEWAIDFPQEEFLIARPCLRRACLGNHIAGLFLSYLLYQASISKEFRNYTKLYKQQYGCANEDVPGFDGDITIYKTQQEIIQGMNDEFSDRTLRDTAIPLLIALGYIDIDTSDKTNSYTIHMPQIQTGINNPPKREDVLPKLYDLIKDRNAFRKHRRLFREKGNDCSMEQ